MKSMVKKLKLSLRSGSSEKSKEKEKAIQEERWFLDNGSKFLRELIADCNGKSIPIRNFSPEQILKATNNFDSSCFVQAGLFRWYRGKIEDRSYMIKIFDDKINVGFQVKEIYNDIVLSARMSNHINFLKLLGCCLEFPFPVLLYEFAEHGVMNDRGGIMVNGEESLLPWSLRLKIGKDIANAVSYLHMAFPKIIIHRDVKPRHVLLDKNWTAKLSDLSSSIILPEGKTRIEAPFMGTLGYFDPLYWATSFVTEYTDVFSFGVFLLVILTGKPALITGSDGDAKHALSSYGDPQHVLRNYVRGLCEKGKLDEVIDPVMINDITSGQRSEMEAYVLLALRCCAERDEDRPKMIQVAKELKRIERIEPSLDAISGFLKPEILEDGLSGQRNPEARLRSCSY